MRINMNDKVLPGINKGTEEMAQEIRLAAVVKQYDSDMMSQRKVLHTMCFLQRGTPPHHSRKEND